MLCSINRLHRFEGSELFFVKLIVAALILIAIIYWFFGTELGASIRATGCNPQMASAQGINTGFTKVLALMISNGLVGLSGGIYAQYQGAADVNMGRGAIGSNLYRSDYLLYCNRTGIVAEDAF